MKVRSFFIPSMLSVLLAPAVASATAGNTEPDICKKHSYNRGIGVAVSTCNPGDELDGAVCYPRCQEGYYGVADWCWERCHEGYADDGALCRRDTHTYGKEYYEQWNMFTGCPSGWSHYYPVCVHTAEQCQAGYRDDGALCTRDAHIYPKDSDYRGPGSPMICADGKQYEDGLCYTPCAAGYSGDTWTCRETCRGDFYYACPLYADYCGDGQDACVQDKSRFVNSCTEPHTAAPGCNGSPANCDRRYDEVAFGATHNSFAVLGAGVGQVVAANHSENITASLRAGVRGLMLDTHWHDGAVHVCHGNCWMADYGTLASVLRSIRRFLDANPTETITIVLESHVIDMDVWQAVVDEGLESYVWENPFPGVRNWPKLGELGKKLLIFNDDNQNRKDPRTKIMAGWRHTFQNPYSFDTTASLTGESACDIGRGSGAVFVMNHFTSAPLATPNLTPANNARSLIEAHASQCMGKGLFPNFVFVDYWNNGDLMGAVQNINGMERPIDPRPFLGKSFYARSVAHAKGFSATPEGTLYLSINRGSWERWRLEDAGSGDGAFFMVNTHNKLLMSDPGGAVHLTPTRGNWERWRLRAAPGGRFVLTSVAHGRNLYTTPEGIFATSTVIGNWEPFTLEDAQLNWIGKSFAVSSSAHRTQMSAPPGGELVTLPNQGGWERWTAEDALGGAVYLRGANNLFLSSQANGSTSLTATQGNDEKWRIQRTTAGQVVLSSWAHGRQLFAGPEGTLATSTAIGNWEPFHIKEAPSPCAGKSVFITNPARGTRISVSPEDVLSQSQDHSSRETWGVEDVGDGNVYLLGDHGKRLSSDPNGGVWVTPNQLDWERWRIGRTPSGATYLASATWGRYLSVKSDGTLETIEKTATRPLGSAEEFRISDAASNYVGKSFFITAARHGGQIYVTPEGVIARSAVRKSWETWTADDAGNGEVFLRGAHGTVLQSNGSGDLAMTPNRGPWERWRVDRTPDGNVVLTIAAHGLHLGVTPGGAFYAGTNEREWEQWIVDVIP